MNLDLFYDTAEPARARNSDPGTSKAAGAAAARFAGSHAERVLVTLQTHGPRTAHEIGQMVGLTVVQIDRRLPELAKQGRAQVKRLDDGADMVRGGCRVWEAAQ